MEGLLKIVEDDQEEAFLPERRVVTLGKQGRKVKEISREIHRRKKGMMRENRY